MPWWLPVVIRGWWFHRLFSLTSPMVHLTPSGHSRHVPSVAEWSKAPESDAGAGGESPVRAPVREGQTKKGRKTVALGKKSLRITR